MLEILAIFFLSKKNARLAVKKGLNPRVWRMYTIVAWILTELTGMILAMGIFGFNTKDDLIGLALVGLISAFGGYLIVRFILEKKPDAGFEDEINRIGIDDLRPPKN